MLLAVQWSLGWWAWLLIFVAILLVGFIAGMIVSRKITSKYLEKNPPINENMIRAMMSQMGRKPSEKQVKQVMKAMNDAK